MDPKPSFCDLFLGAGDSGQARAHPLAHPGSDHEAGSSHLAGREKERPLAAGLGWEQTTGPQTSPGSSRSLNQETGGPEGGASLTVEMGRGQCLGVGQGSGFIQEQRKALEMMRFELPFRMILPNRMTQPHVRSWF